MKLRELKLYLKIIGISYLRENTNTSIMLDMVEEIIKKNHLFNNIMLVLGVVYTRGKSLQDRLGDVQTCKTTSAYVLHCLSVTWSQLQIIGRSLR